MAEAEYGSEENNRYIEDRKIEGYVKYNHFDRDKKKQRKDNTPISVEKLYYNKQEDCYYCPMGQRMSTVGEKIRPIENNYERRITECKAIDSIGCPIRSICHKSQSARFVSVCHTGN